MPGGQKIVLLGLVWVHPSKPVIAKAVNNNPEERSVWLPRNWEIPGNHKKINNIKRSILRINNWYDKNWINKQNSKLIIGWLLNLCQMIANRYFTLCIDIQNYKYHSIAKLMRNYLIYKIREILLKCSNKKYCYGVLS